MIFPLYLFLIDGALFRDLKLSYLKKRVLFVTLQVFCTGFGTTFSPPLWGGLKGGVMTLRVKIKHSRPLIHNHVPVWLHNGMIGSVLV